ncbi:MAG: hypothetical protein JKY65_32740 [Planctomycetes bacterium]|nr:hypothetical protein [Planctomycetota bacterium]
MNKIAMAGMAVLLSGGVVLGQTSFETRVLARYQAGDRPGADRLLQTRTSAARFDESQTVAISAVFKSRDQGLTIRVERRAEDSKKQLWIAIPPGTCALPRVTNGKRHDPLPQDLLLIRPSILSLAPGARSADVTLPVACAAFRRDGPEAGVRYTIQRVKPGSNLDRLALALCARREVPKSLDPALALAIWIAHEDLGYQRLARSSLGFRTFRTPRQRVGAEHGPAAAALLHAAGLDLNRFDFYRSGGTKARGDVPARAKQTPKAKAKKNAKAKKVKAKAKKKVRITP